MKHLLKFNDYEILLDEYIRFKQRISELNSNTPYYVYALCYANGEPFYIGKGKNNRAFQHVLAKQATKKIQVIIDSLEGEAPIVHVIRDNLTEQEAINLESENITRFGRIRFEKGQLVNFMPHGITTKHDICVQSGKLGGKITRENNLGIFSPEYDRSQQTKLNHELGVYDYEKCQYGGLIGGTISVSKQLGIHDPKYREMRSEWGKIGSNSVKTRGGIVNKDWREQNKDTCFEICSRGGKLGGKKTGSMLWWNNGSINKKSFEKPDGDWVRGMLMSEKKRASLFGKNKVTVTPSKNDN